jgi:hypothetical protein
MEPEVSGTAPLTTTVSFTEYLQLKEMRAALYAALYKVMVSETHAQAIEIARAAVEKDQERQR